MNPDHQCWPVTFTRVGATVTVESQIFEDWTLNAYEILRNNGSMWESKYLQAGKSEILPNCV